jgi:anti-sigma B factor antagonist
MNLVIDERPGGIVVVGWVGHTVLDAANAAELRQRIHAIERRYSRIVLDMSEIEFIDSSIIGALVGVLRRVRAAGGDLKVAALTPDIETIFEVTRLQQVFSVHPSVAAAVRDFGVAPA